MTPLQAVSYLVREYGWTREQACGIMANLIWEGGTKREGPINDWKIETTLTGDNGKAHGAGQWQKERYWNLLKYTKEEWPGHSSSELEVQLGYLNWEMNRTEKKAKKFLEEAKTLEGATEAVCTYYLRPSIPHLDKRISIAKELYNA